MLAVPLRRGLLPRLSVEMVTLSVPSSRSKTFRKMAADALRASRKAAPGSERERI